MKKENQMANCKSLETVTICEKGAFTPNCYYWYKEVSELRNSKFIVKDDNDDEVEFDSIEFEHSFAPYKIELLANEWEIRQIRNAIKIVQLLSEDEDKRRKLCRLYMRVDDLFHEGFQNMKDHTFLEEIHYPQTDRISDLDCGIKLRYDSEDPRAIEFARGFPNAEPY